MILVDTGYFIARAEPRDVLHERAIRWERALSEPLLVTEHVLWEVVNHFSEPLHRPKAHLIVSMVLQSASFEFVEADSVWFDRGMKLHEARPDKAWSLTDCISFEVMRDRNVTRALTYDHHFEQAGFEALLRRDPP
jgi:predicted nucleic acid-binding protein